PPIKGEIEFRNLSFSYDAGDPRPQEEMLHSSSPKETETAKPVEAKRREADSRDVKNLDVTEKDTRVLREINLKIEPGKTIAFVGRTGSGKSTLVGLVPRLMDAPDDSLFIDGIPVRHFPLAQLRRSIGFVPQETFLFSDTLAENIAMGVGQEWETGRGADGGTSGKPEATSSIHSSAAPTRQLPFPSSPVLPLSASPRRISSITVETAADVAGLASDIKDFPDRYEQLVGERGITLSGGQKQRTAIARAVMRDPRILILDDSLSAVDTYTEEKILHNLRDIRAERTTLIVSHRVSTIRDADLICVLDRGQIIERGTHEELIKLDGEYADLYERQLLEEELEATD
ncbi:MAG: ATP-binding cassette domain-containing protein, partial [Acidobacteriota bacterium]